MIDLKKFEGIHKKKRAFIVGNGPSLSVADLDCIKDEISFAANKIYLLYDKSEYRPTYYTCVDLIFIENHYELVNHLPGIKFFPTWAKQYITSNKDHFFFKELGLPINKGFLPLFSKDLAKGLYGGYTVTYNSIQIAWYMGIREIYLIGMDHIYNLSSQTVLHEKYGTIMVSEGEKNHFSDQYREKGEAWSIPRPEYQEMAFAKALLEFQQAGANIYNCTKGGGLEVFPRMAFDEVIK